MAGISSLMPWRPVTDNPLHGLRTEGLLMTTEQVIALVQQLFLTAFLVGLPALAVSLIVGLVVSIVQTITSIQDQTLSYVPKILIVGLVIVFTLGFSLQLAVGFFQRMVAFAVGAGK
jgi:flagellar biosynthesis protein FliQ